MITWFVKFATLGGQEGLTWIVIYTAIMQIPFINEGKQGCEFNILYTQNVCKVVDENPNIRDMIMASSWHAIGESELEGIINEEIGLRPEKLEDRAMLYALSKIAQECIVRFHDEIPEKIFGILKMEQHLATRC